MSILNKIQENIDAPKVNKEKFKEINQIIEPLKKIWSSFSNSSSDLYQYEKMSNKELQKTLNMIDVVIQNTIEKLKNIDVEIELGSEKGTGFLMIQDTKIKVDGKPSTDFQYVDSYNLKNLAGYFDRALRVKSKLKEELGVRTGKKSSIEQRKASDIESKKIRKYYSTKHDI